MLINKGLNTLPKFLTLVLLLISCNKNSSTKKIESIQSKKKKTASIIKEKKIIDSLNEIDFRLEAKDIKKQVTKVTTSFLSKNETKIFIKKPKNNFFGVYYLIKGMPESVVGKMVIYDDINPYKFDKNTDQFIEINLWDKGISLYDNSIEVGMNKSELIKIFGQKFIVQNDIMIYKDIPYKAFFKIKNDKVSNIKIGIYRESTKNSDILKYEW